METNYEDLGWNSDCRDNCYLGWPHSHEPTLGKKVTKECDQCKKEMLLKFQVLNHGLGNNQVELSNVYQCDSCKLEIREPLYIGIQKNRKEIYEEVYRQYG